VGIECGETGDVLGDVLEAPSAEGRWPDGRRYDIGLIDGVCQGGHAHVLPTQDEIAVRVAEAKQFQTVIWHRVKVRR
jgi:hypothetical protein